MEELALVKVSELTLLLNEIQSIKKQIRDLSESEERLKAYSIQQVAEMLKVHHSTVRKLIYKKELFAKHLDGNHGKCMIPAWSVTQYLETPKQ